MSRVNLLIKPSGCSGLVISLLIIAILMPFQWPDTVNAAGVQYYRTISVRSGKVPSILTDFPILISLNDSTLKTVYNSGHVANSDGSDIYFTDPSGAVRYACEIEKYDGSTGSLIAWVKVPELADGSELKMWYGGNRITDNNPAGTWDSYYKGIWHMSRLNPPDSSINGNNGTAVETNIITVNGTEPQPVSGTTGKIDGANLFTNFVSSNNGTVPNGLPGHTGSENKTPDDDYIDIPNSSSLAFIPGGQFTWSAWVNLSSTPGAGGMGLIGKSTKNTKGYEIYFKNGGCLTFEDDSSQSAYKVNSVAAFTVSNGWTQVAIVYDNLAISMYANGAPISTSGALTSSMTSDSSSDVYIGYRRNINNGNGLFDGVIDEVEYSNTARSADWIKTQYVNQSNPANFYYVGDETQAQAVTLLSVDAASGNYGGMASFSATLTSGGIAVSGKTVNFTLNGNNAGSNMTDSNGLATVTNVALSGIAAGTYPGYIGATFAGDYAYKASNGTGTLTVNAVITSSGGGGGGGSSYFPPVIVTPTPSPTPTPTPTATPTPSQTTVNTPSPSPTPGVTDLNSSVNSGGKFTTVVQASSADRTVTLDIAVGVIGHTAGGLPIQQISINPAANNAPAPEQAQAVALSYDMQPNGAIFDPPISLTFKYDPAAIPDGSSPYVAWWNGNRGQWEPLITIGIDSSKGTITASVSHFSLFSAFAPVVAASPSPTISESPAAPVVISSPVLPVTPETPAALVASASTVNVGLIVGIIAGICLVTALAIWQMRRRHPAKPPRK